MWNCSSNLDSRCKRGVGALPITTAFKRGYARNADKVPLVYSTATRVEKQDLPHYEDEFKTPRRRPEAGFQNVRICLLRRRLFATLFALMLSNPADRISSPRSWPAGTCGTAGWSRGTARGAGSQAGRVGEQSRSGFVSNVRWADLASPTMSACHFHALLSSGMRCTVRSFPPSATGRFPDGSKAIAAGRLNCPFPLLPHQADQPHNASPQQCQRRWFRYDGEHQVAALHGERCRVAVDRAAGARQADD